MARWLYGLTLKEIDLTAKVFRSAAVFMLGFRTIQVQYLP